MVQPPGLFDGEGVAALLRGTDWAGTPLGDPDGWTPTLRSMVRFVLNAPVPMCLLWSDDLVQLYNDAYAALIGEGHPGQLLISTGEAWGPVFEAFRPIHRRVLEGEGVRIEDYSLSMDRGAGPETVWLSTVLTPVFDGEAVAGSLVVSEEVTGRRRAADAERRRAEIERSALEKAVRARTIELEVSTELLEAVLDTQAVSVSVLEAVRDAQGRLVDLEYVLVNAQTTRMARGADLTGRRFSDMFPGVRTDGILEAFLAVVDTGQPLDIEFHYTDPWFDEWLRCTAVRLRSSGLVVTAERITDRVRKDRELEQIRRDLLAARNALERELDAVMDAVPDAVTVYDTNANITYANHATREFFEAVAVEAEQPLGERLSRPYLTTPDGHPLTLEELPLHRALTLGDVVRGTVLRATVTDGVHRYLSVSCAPIRDAAGQITGAVAVTRDVTESWQEAARKSAFLSTLSHELRNPLTTMLLNLGLIRSHCGAAPQADAAPVLEAVGMAERQVQQVSGLVEDLMDLTRIAQGRMRLVCEPVDLTRLVERVVEDNRVRFTAAGKDVSVVRPEGGPIYVEADPLRLTQVVSNLLDNAAKFTSTGDATTVAVTVDDEAGEAVLSVTDTGAGIEPASAPTLFEPFAQHGPVPTRRAAGLGLGLTIVRAIVELHGGTVELASDGPGHGAVATVTLPRTSPPGQRIVTPAVNGVSSLDVPTKTL